MNIIYCLRDIYRFCSREVKLIEFQRKWRQLNINNYTNAGCIFPIDKVSVGLYTYGTLNVISYYNNDEKLVIGKYCSIAGGTTFILSGEHNYSRLSSFPFSRVVLNGEPESICKGPIILEDDVWIGYGSTILSGVTIGKGTIIGAGSIVRKDIAPYSIYVGDRVVKRRFKESIIRELEQFDFPDFSPDEVSSNMTLFQQSLTENNVGSIIRKIRKMKDA